MSHKQQQHHLVGTQQNNGGDFATRLVDYSLMAQIKFVWCVDYSFIAQLKFICLSYNMTTGARFYIQYRLHVLLRCLVIGNLCQLAHDRCKNAAVTSPVNLNVSFLSFVSWHFKLLYCWYRSYAWSVSDFSLTELQFQTATISNRNNLKPCDRPEETNLYEGSREVDEDKDEGDGRVADLLVVDDVHEDQVTGDDQ